MKHAARRRFLLAALAGLLVVACAQPVPVDQRPYIGHWRGDGVLLVIGGDGQGHYERVRGDQRTSISGPVHGFSTGGFKMGIGPLSASFAVQQPPARDQDGTWRMQVDGVELRRLDIAPVASDGNSVRL